MFNRLLVHYNLIYNGQVNSMFEVMSVWNNVKKAFGNFGKWIKSLGIAKWWRSATGQELSGAQQEANAFSAQQAEVQREYETQMSNTAYQRQVADMKNAGINPALMYGGSASGASTPSVASPASVDPGQPGLNPIGLLGQIQQLYLLKSQKANVDADSDLKRQKIEESKSVIEQIKAGINKTIAESDSIRQGIENMKLDAEEKSIILKYLDEKESVGLANLKLSGDAIVKSMAETDAKIANLDAQNQRILQDVVESMQRVDNMLAEKNLTLEQVKEVTATISNIRQQTKLLDQQTQIAEKDVEYYFWNNVGSAAAKGVSGVAKLFKGNPFKKAPKIGFK